MGGGGDHGYLGLVLSDAEYLAIPTVFGTRFVPPAYPGPLVIPPTANAVQAVQARESHQEQVRQYRECNHVEKALLKHLQNTLEPKYVEAFVDEDTALLSTDIPTILDHLTNRYGQVCGTEVQQFLNEVLQTPYTPAEPLVMVWNPIQKLKKLAIQAKIPYSEPQLIEFALQIIRSTHDFEKALGEWEAKPTADKTWTNLKLHFSQAQEELKKIRGPTMVQAGFHQINNIAHDIREEFQQTRTELANMATLLKLTDDSSQHTPVTEASSISDLSTNRESANATSEANIQLEMMKLLKSMQNEISNLSNNNGGNNNRGGKPKSYRKTSDNPSFTRRTTDQYCWTHGGCAHAGDKCTMKAPGHKDAATFENKMGGSKAFCE